MSTTKNVPKVKLNKLVNKLVDKWSIEYVEKAHKGDFEAMLKVADIQYSRKGWGKIAHNPYQGRRWIEFAASRGDPYALFALKNLVIGDEIRKDKLTQLLRYNINSYQHPRAHLTLEQQFQIQIRGINPKTILNPDKYQQSNWESKLPTVPNYEDGKKALLGQYTPSRRLRNGLPHALYRFPHVLSRDSAHYTIKSILDGRIQHRVTDPVPRPISEYIHASAMPAPGTVDVRDLAKAIFEADVLTPEGQKGTFDEKGVVHDGRGSSMTGAQVQMLLERLDDLDKRHIPFDLDLANTTVAAVKEIADNAGHLPSAEVLDELIAAQEQKDDDPLKHVDPRGYNAHLFLTQQQTVVETLPTLNLDPYTDEFHAQRVKAAYAIKAMYESKDANPLSDESIAGLKEMLPVLPKVDLFGDDAPDADGAFCDGGEFSDMANNILSDFDFAIDYTHTRDDFERTFGTIFVDAEYSWEGRFPYRSMEDTAQFSTDPNKIGIASAHLHELDDYDAAPINPPDAESPHVKIDQSQAFVRFLLSVAKNDPNVLVLEAGDIRKARAAALTTIFDEGFITAQKEKYRAAKERDNAKRAAVDAAIAENEGTTSDMESYDDVNKHTFSINEMANVQLMDDTVRSSNQEDSDVEAPRSVIDAKKYNPKSVEEALDKLLEDRENHNTGVIQNMGSPFGIYPWDSSINHYSQIPLELLEDLCVQQGVTSPEPDTSNIKDTTKVLETFTKLTGQEYEGHPGRLLIVASYPPLARFIREEVPQKISARLPEMYPEFLIRSPELTPELAAQMVERIRLVHPSLVSVCENELQRYEAGDIPVHPNTISVETYLSKAIAQDADYQANWLLNDYLLEQGIFDSEIEREAIMDGATLSELETSTELEEDFDEDDDFYNSSGFEEEMAKFHELYSESESDSGSGSNSSGSEHQR